MKQRPFRQIEAYSSLFWDNEAYSNIFRHNEANLGIIQACSDIFGTLCNPGVFRTFPYSEPKTYLLRAMVFLKA